MSESLLVCGLVVSASLCLGVATNRASRASILEGLGVARMSRSPSGDRPGRLLARKWVGSILRVASVALLGGVVAGSPGALAGLAGAILVPRLRRAREARLERELAESQLTGAVSALAAGLRAGQSVSQALRFAAAEAEPPLATQLREVVDREDLGVRIEESIERWARTTPDQEVRVLAGVLRMRVGEGLPALLDELVGTLRHRRSARREIASLTAQARLSGWILGLLPIGFFLFLSLTARGDMQAAVATTAGLASITSGLVLEAGALLWIRRLLRVAW